MSLETLIDDSRHAIEADPIKAKAVFAIHGDLVVLTEVDLHARGHAVKVDEPPSLGGEELRRLIGPVPQLVLFEIVPRPWAPIEPRARGNRLLLSGGLAAPAENPCKKQVPEEGLEPPTRGL